MLLLSAIYRRLLSPTEKTHTILLRRHSLPKPELELVSKAPGDCRGLTVLDLGGGTGIYARRAVSQGAELVHFVDGSPSRLDNGRTIEASQSSREDKGKIQYVEGSPSRLLRNLPLLRDGYDEVMCNWVFNSARTNEELESIWRTACKCTKLGGKLIDIRAIGPFDITECYGITMSELHPIADGIKLKVRFAFNPPFEHGAFCLDEVSDLSNDRHGFGDSTVLSPEDTEIVRSNEAFWREFLIGPYFVVSMATKL